MRWMPFRWLGLGILGLGWNLAWAAPSATLLQNFDLFGFPASAMEQNLGQRARTLGQALASAFPKETAEQKFHENSYSGVCYRSEKTQYRLSWRDSETEGFSFTVEKLTDQKTCANPYTDGAVYKSYPLAPAQFFPVSRSHPSIQLGVSTPATIQKEMGVPLFSNATKMIYVLKRDREKEKNCGMDPKKGEIEAIEIEFDFKEKVLSGVSLHNFIAGEC